MHILEMMNPKRSDEIRKNELSADLKKIRDEREEKTKAIEENPTEAIEGKPAETEATEERKEEDKKDQEEVTPT
jgi:hypothetical protein